MVSMGCLASGFVPPVHFNHFQPKLLNNSPMFKLVDRLVGMTLPYNKLNKVHVCRTVFFNYFIYNGD